MKLRNKKTGEIKDWDFIGYFNEVCGKTYGQWECDLKEFMQNAENFRNEWEDYEEPKGYWFIDIRYPKVEPKKDINLPNCMRERLKGIGNYFETKEEAELAVRKLKAWKRLKDKGFKVDLWDYDGGNYQERIKTGRILFRVKDYEENDKDLELLFGSEE